MTARVVNLLFFFALTWAVILSSIPLVLSTYLLLLIFKAFLNQGFVAPTQHGHWYVHCDGSVRFDAPIRRADVLTHKQASDQLMHVDISALPFKVTFRLRSGRRVTIWRDSCEDQHYRQLYLVLHQWQIKQGADAPC